MKKIFLAKRNALLSSTDFSWGAYALLVALLALGMRLFAPNVFWHTAAPLFRGADFFTATSNAFFAGFGERAVLALENENLRVANAALANENRALKGKAMDLEALFDSSGEEEGMNTGILAGVIARPPESPYDTLLLAKGSTAGVTVGMGAFGAGNVPVGIVSSVAADFSRITLFSSPGMHISGWAGEANTPVTVIGKGGGAFDASLARFADVAVGDSVFGPGPGMLPIGEIVRIDNDPAAPSMMLRIRPVLNPFSITWVVLKNIGKTL